MCRIPQMLLGSLAFVGAAALFALSPSLNLAQDNVALQPIVPPSSIEPAVKPSEDAKWLERANRIMEIGSLELKTAEQRDAAYKELAVLRPTKEDDSRIQFAFALVALKEKKWEGALGLMTDLLEHDASYVPARAARVRIYMHSSKMAQVIVDLETLAKDLRTAAPNVTIDQQEYAARFLGLMAGYFEGPGKSLIKATVLAELISDAEKLPDLLKTGFQESRRAILEEFRVLSEEGEEAFKKFKDGLEKEADDMRKELESQKSRVSEESESLKKELEGNWSRLNSEWQNVWQNCQGLSQNINLLIQQRSVLQGELAAVRPPRVDPNGNVDPLDEQRYQSILRRLRFSIANLDQQIVNLESQFNQARFLGVQLERQMSNVQTQSRRLGMNLQAQRESFNRMDASIRSKELQAAKAEPKKTPAQLRRERAFTTYDDFNFHKEKKLLLDPAE